MSDSVFHLRPLTLREAFEKWVGVASLVLGGRPIHATFTTSLSPFSLDSVTTNGHALLDVPSVRALEHEIVANELLHVECRCFAIRTNNDPRIEIQYNALSDDISAEVKIVGTEKLSNDAPAAKHIVQTLASLFTFTSPSSLFIERLPSAQKAILRAHSAELERLEAETAKIAQFNLNQIKEQSEFLRKSTVDLEERARKREEELEQKRKLIDEGIAVREKALDEQNKEKIAAIEKREEELKLKIEAIDVRENMAVRRQLLTQIADRLDAKSTFTLSESVDKKRESVRSTCRYSIIGSLCWLAIVLAYIANTVVRGGELKWYQYAPLSVGMVFLLSTVVYYLKWSDQWAREHAQAEVRNKQLYADILRASWLAEMFFEGRDKERLLPDLLLARFSEGLFTNGTLSAPEHPSDQMVDLLKKLSNVKVSKDGVEVTKSAAEEKK